MELTLQGQVECSDGGCGRSEYVLINPISEQVTHLVVRQDSGAHTEYMVPVEMVTAGAAGTVHLSCSQAELEKLEPFIQTGFIAEQVPDYESNMGPSVGPGYYWPYVSPDITVYTSVEERQIPLNETALRRGTRVEATDGYVGHVDELVISPAGGHITHLVLREGHLWGQKDVTIPVSAVEVMHEATVYLKLTKHEIEALPAIPLARRWA